VSTELAIELCLAIGIFTFIGTHWALTRNR